MLVSCACAKKGKRRPMRSERGGYLIINRVGGWGARDWGPNFYRKARQLGGASLLAPILIRERQRDWGKIAAANGLKAVTSEKRWQRNSGAGWGNDEIRIS